MHAARDSGLIEPAAQAKGTNLIPTVKFLRSRRDEARRLLPPELHTYLDRRVLPASWYPEADLMTMLRVLVHLIGGDERATWELVGQQAAEAHAAGPYEGVLRLGPRRLLESLDAFWHLQHDTGRWEVSFPRDTVAEVSLTEFPAGMPDYGHLLVGYFRGILALAGAKGVAVVLVACDGSSGRWRSSWEL